MSGDHSRIRFDPEHDYAGVFMQQGRVQLDADWNELVDVLDRRLRAQTVDQVPGRCFVSRRTPHAFRITAHAGELSIDPGRMVVDGLVAENHGAGPVELDPVLHERRGTRGISYQNQPYSPAPVPLPSGGPHLLYLEVWRREVTAAEAPELIDEAVGVDTTTRHQTVWQVKVLPNATCDDKAAWEQLVAPSAGRLSTRTVEPDDAVDPCFATPESGYRGVENRLYRVEIHHPGDLGEATFKWSRDNASLVARVTHVAEGESSQRTVLTVDSTGRDEMLRFRKGDWVEVLDDTIELADDSNDPGARAGLMRKVHEVDFPGRRLVLLGKLPPVPLGDTDPERHVRVKKWDQHGVVTDDAGNTFDVDANDGVLPIDHLGVWIPLEDGVEVLFARADGPKGFRTGDFWSVAARTVTGQVEELKEAPPRGVGHHYCKLAEVTFPNQEKDCRPIWGAAPPPPTPPTDEKEPARPVEEHAHCGCDFCVTETSHAEGTLTLQQAVDALSDRGGTICVGAGVFVLDAPLDVGVGAIRIAGTGGKTALVHAGPEPAIHVHDASGVILERLAVLTVGDPDHDLDALAKTAADLDVMAALFSGLGGEATEDPAPPALSVVDTIGVTVRRCALFQIPSHVPAAPVVRLGGVSLLTRLERNLVIGGTGIGNGPAPAELLIAASAEEPDLFFTFGLAIEKNVVHAKTAGIKLSGNAFCAGLTTIAGNQILAGGEGGGGILVQAEVVVEFRSSAKISSRLEIRANAILARASGLVLGAGRATVADNAIGSLAKAETHGVELVPGFSEAPLDDVVVAGNRIAGLFGHGVRVRTPLGAATIERNVFEDLAGAGVVMEPEASRAASLTVRANRLRRVAVEPAAGAAAGVVLFAVERAVVVDNEIVGVGPEGEADEPPAAVRCVLCQSARIEGNEIAAAEASQRGAGTIGIDVLGMFDRLDVLDNRVRPSDGQLGGTPEEYGGALRIGEVDADDGHAAVAFSRIPASGRQPPVTMVGDRVVSFVARGMVTVRGNTFEGGGRDPIVAIVADGPCSLNENRCSVVERLSQPAVAVDASSVIAGSNRLETGGKVALQIVRAVPHTVIGNICRGEIQVQGAPLGDPWKPLNIEQ